MKALISPNELLSTGFRVAEISENGFDVASPLFWIDCDPSITHETCHNYFYNIDTKSIELIQATAQENKDKASMLLYQSDWVTNSDVVDTTSTHYLINATDFISYRAQLRAIVVNPPKGNITWPTLPSANWSS